MSRSLSRTRGFTLLELLVVLVILGLVFSNVASAVTDEPCVVSIPEEICKLMEQKECSPIKKFYSRDLTIFPPFIYAEHLLAGHADLIVFACEMHKPTKSGRYKIVLMKKSFSKDNQNYIYSNFEECPNEIYFRDMPGGLSVHSNIRPSDSTVPQDISTHENTFWHLKERAEGVGTGFFCSQGDWHREFYH